MGLFCLLLLVFTWVVFALRGLQSPSSSHSICYCWSCWLSLCLVVLTPPPCVSMSSLTSPLRWQRISVLWNNWMFNQEPSDKSDPEAEHANPDRSRSERPRKSAYPGSHPDGCSEGPADSRSRSGRSAGVDSGTGSSLDARNSQERAACVLQVDNGSEGEEGALHRDGSQRTSRRRFRRVNPRGERELITEGQDPPSCYNTVRTPISVTCFRSNKS